MLQLTWIYGEHSSTPQMVENESEIFLAYEWENIFIDLSV